MQTNESLGPVDLERPKKTRPKNEENSFIWYEFVFIIVIVAGLVMVILATLGPAIGNVFSTIMVGI